MLRRHFAAWLFPIGAMIPGAVDVFGQAPSTGSGQAYPNKTIRIIAAEVGGNGDFNARLIAQGISGPLGQNLIVENRPAALTGEIVSKAIPDGYTVVVLGSTFVLGPLLRKTPYDPVRDFSPISMLTRSPSVLVVHPLLAANSVKEFIALAKAKPGVLNYASSETGSITHLSAELFKAMAGINIIRINYKGSGQAVNALIGGEVQLTFGTAAGVARHIKTGRLRALAVASAEPSALFPGLPTVAASGLPGYEAGSILGLFAPAKTPGTIINLLNQEITRFLKTAEAREKFFNSGVEAAPSLDFHGAEFP